MGIYDDDGAPDGTYNYSHNMGGTGKHEVIVKVNSLPGNLRIKYRYNVVLEVEHDWQAKAIAAILNGG